jgi:hypothetical protein
MATREEMSRYFWSASTNCLPVARTEKSCSKRKKLLKSCRAQSGPLSYPEPFLCAVRRGAMAKSLTGYHKNMVRKQYPVLELANQMPVRNMDLARAPRRTARKKGSGYENESGHAYPQGLSAARVLPRPWDTQNRKCKTICSKAHALELRRFSTRNNFHREVLRRNEVFVLTYSMLIE